VSAFEGLPVRHEPIARQGFAIRWQMANEKKEKFARPACAPFFKCLFRENESVEAQGVWNAK
jgi:hypothetical protein